MREGRRKGGRTSCCARSNLHRRARAVRPFHSNIWSFGSSDRQQATHLRTHQHVPSYKTASSSEDARSKIERQTYSRRCNIIKRSIKMPLVKPRPARGSLLRWDMRRKMKFIMIYSFDLETWWKLIVVFRDFSSSYDVYLWLNGNCRPVWLVISISKPVKDDLQRKTVNGVSWNISLTIPRISTPL